MSAVRKIRGEAEYLEAGAPRALRELEASLTARVIGQEDGIAEIVRALARYRAGLAGQDSPIAAFLLLGPTGVGKTLTVEAMAELLHGSPRAVLKVHCAELRSDHELARMKGSPPGYVGWKECVPLFHDSRLKEVRLRDEPALVLFDEIEKAHPALWDLLLGMLDKGEVVLNDNTRADFRRTIVFLTGNAGAREMAEALNGSLGFQPHTRGDMN
ncbi:MAG: AAA family ATPase, partial [Terriglobales bacterium]